MRIWAHRYDRDGDAPKVDTKKHPDMRVPQSLEDELALELPREPQSVILEGLD